MGTLYLVATPIGNLEDITLRALRVLREAGLIAAEDTRTTRKLLARYGISTPLTSYHEHNKREKTPFLLRRLEETDVALVTEAGQPAISDPGWDLVAAAVERGLPVVPVPGPSAVTTALAVSGLPADRFLFLGFLPRKTNDRRRLLREVASSPWTLVAFEAPHRLREALEDIREVLGDRRLAVCRELTKAHEEVFRGTVGEALARFSRPQGEFTLVIQGAQGAPAEPQRERAWQDLARLRRAGVRAREAVGQVALARGLPRREVYRMWLALGREGAGGR